MINEAAYLERLGQLQRDAWPNDISQKVRYPLGEKPLTEYLRHWARTRGNVDALIFYGTTLTYRQLDRMSDAFANVLAAAGVGRGDRVAVLLPNCPQFHIAFFGILKLRAVHVPISPLSGEAELSAQLEDCQPKALVALDRLMPAVRAACAHEPALTIFVTSPSQMLPADPTMEVPATVAHDPVDCPDARDFLAEIAEASTDPRDDGDLDSIAALNYTGGTTGLPKGCIHTQRNMVYVGAANWTVAMGADEDIVWLSFFPEFWIAGENSALVYPVLTGRPLVLMSRWDPVAFMQAVTRYKVSHTALIVDGVVELMEHLRFDEFDLTSLKRVRVISFVKKLAIEHRRRWFDLTGTTLVESSWGMTETHTASTFTTGMQHDDFDLRSQPIFVGLPIPGTEFKICDFETRELLPLGQEGEIVVRSPSLFKGYWNKPQEAASALRNGWLHTGDLGVIDEAGYLHYLGRRKEMLKVKGMSVFPAELEALLGKHPAVLGSGVVGRNHSQKGQVPVAFVQLRPESVGKVGETEIADWLKERIAAFKVPEIHLITALPLTSTGKIRKTDLATVLENMNGGTGA